MAAYLKQILTNIRAWLTWLQATIPDDQDIVEMVNDLQAMRAEAAERGLRLYHVDRFASIQQFQRADKLERVIQALTKNRDLS